MFESAIEVACLGMVGALVVCGVFIPLRILNFLDLTCDGSYAVGCCAYGFALINGASPISAILLSTIIGMCCGSITAFFHTYVKIPKALCGVIMLTILASFTHKFPFLSAAQFSKAKIVGNSYVSIFLVIPMVAGILFAIHKLLTSEFGLRFRSAGAEEIFADSFSKGKTKMIWFGLSISSGIIALSGALSSHITGVINSTAGTGMFIFALAAIIIGERFVKCPKCNAYLELFFSLMIGAIYQIVLIVSSSVFSSKGDMAFAYICISVFSVFIYSVVRDKETPFKKVFLDKSSIYY